MISWESSARALRMSATHLVIDSSVTATSPRFHELLPRHHPPRALDEIPHHLKRLRPQLNLTRAADQAAGCHIEREVEK
jgi:hypothetical protein